MNRDFQEPWPQAEDLERLEWATSSTAPAADGADPQAAALREAWMAWGRLLETAESPMEPSLGRPAVPQSKPLRWLPLGAGVAAAILAIVAGTAWFALKSDRATNVPALPKTIASVAQAPTNAASATSGTARPAPAAQPKALAASGAAEPQWNDAMDDDIVQVSRQLVAVQQGWHASADAFGAVRSQLERMHSEVEAADSDHPSAAPTKQADPARPEKTAPSGNRNEGTGSSAPIPSFCGHEPECTPALDSSFVVCGVGEAKRPSTVDSSHEEVKG